MGTVDEIAALAAPHMTGFLNRIDGAFRSLGLASGLPPHLREAVEATPRHRFVHRFRDGPEGPLRDFDADPASLLPLVYQGQPLTHVDENGTPLASTNSEAAYVLWLVDRLGIRPADRVLEVGSGSGWLLAIMAQLVGPDGQATGIEIVPSLAAQSRRDLAALGVGRATVIDADATAGPLQGGPFNRVIVTAATWDVPRHFFDLVAEGGRLLVPLRLARDEGCEVLLLRREGDTFIAESNSPGWFVPLVGATQAAAIDRARLDALSFWGDIGSCPTRSDPLWLGDLTTTPSGPAVASFRRYLALTEPAFAMIEPQAKERAGKRIADFGLIDRGQRSVALYEAGRLISFGAPHAARRFAAAYDRWAGLGMPGPPAYTLRIVPAEAAPPGSDTTFVERRGDCAIVRQLDREAGSWRDLLGSD